RRSSDLRSFQLSGFAQRSKRLNTVLPRTELYRQSPPRNPGPARSQHRFDEISVVFPGRPAPRLARRAARIFCSDARPAAVQPCWPTHGSHLGRHSTFSGTFTLRLQAGPIQGQTLVSRLEKRSQYLRPDAGSVLAKAKARPLRRTPEVRTVQTRLA